MVHTRKMYRKDIEVTSRSVRFFKEKPRVSNRSPARRGDIRGFSRHSALRLRETLHRFTVRDCLVFSFTFTVPWAVKFFDGRFDLYKDCWSSFRHHFRFWFPNSAIVFRHEMQQRRVPHTHAVVYVSVADLPVVSSGDAFIEFVTAFVFNRLQIFWVKALQDTISPGRFQAFLDNGVSCSRVYDKITLMRYVADHTSKHKEGQLGYRGKQWGIIGRDNLICDKTYRVEFSTQAAMARFSRFVRRLSVYSRPIKNSPFAFKRCRMRSPRSISFVSLSTIVRYARFINRDRLRHGRPILIRFRRRSFRSDDAPPLVPF